MARQVNDQIRKKFESLVAQRCEGYAEGDFPSDMIEPWKLPQCQVPHEIRKKLVIQAFTVGVLKTQPVPSDGRFRFPEGFEEAGHRIGENFDMLRFNFVENEGTVTMTFAEVIDHMRLWINQDEQVKSWGFITRVLLFNACHYMLDEQVHVDRTILETAKEFRMRLKAGRSSCTNEAVKEAPKELPTNEKPDAKLASGSSGFLPGVK